MEVVNQSQIEFPSISDTLHPRETGNSLSKTRDLNVSAKPPQSTRDSCTIATSSNSTFRKSSPGTKTDK